MQVTINQSTLELIQGDITRQECDAIVNAANEQLRGGGGVDGAIRRAGGSAIADECRRIGGCPTGEARITGAGKLKARYVIHTVGPIYKKGWFGHTNPDHSAALLAQAYQSSLELARQYHVRTLAFPSISTGVYGYPLDEAAPIALQTVIDYMQGHPEIEHVTFVLFDAKTFAAYQRALENIT
jgi:O-acetyl-ADP-ribose deacetylase (regulator of RNase III)